ncbi:hypothetical protein FA13DRAFT_597901 [Coprinellus micaceus]|uniref:Uncharacterized protein n=1 Tax=Coprinellus micaceus TaxID=71717 RepID=A0A4Y7T6N6_COPMI|nr:hypothetical protein FA13DRAFT_597901 [Coprinellus micaceus]
MSFYNTPPSSYKPQVRVEGFHLPSPEPPPPPSHHPSSLSSSSLSSQHHPPSHHDPHHNHQGGAGGGQGQGHGRHPSNASTSMVDDLFATTTSTTMPAPPASAGDPLFPSSLGGRRYGSVEFEDDLAALGSMNGHHGGGGHPNHAGHHQQQQQGGSYHDGGHADQYGQGRTHNIFDVSSPIPMAGSHQSQSHLSASHASTGHMSMSGMPGSQPGSLSHAQAAMGQSLGHAQLGGGNQGQGQGGGHSPNEYHVPTHGHFNSTLPALNSSMRYENPGDVGSGGGGESCGPLCFAFMRCVLLLSTVLRVYSLCFVSIRRACFYSLCFPKSHALTNSLSPTPPPPPSLGSTNPNSNSSSTTTTGGVPLTPSSPHPLPSTYALLQRHTPSPTITQPGGNAAAGGAVGAGRQRSRSRPPSQAGLGLPGNIGNAQLPGGVGPARTTRQRRGSSISGTSPPPLGRPHAIVIPGRSSASSSASTSGPNGPLSAGGNTNAGNNGQGPNGSQGGNGQGGGGGGGGSTWFSGNEYSLPTPDSMTGHSYGHAHGYGPFSLSPGGGG